MSTALAQSPAPLCADERVGIEGSFDSIWTAAITDACLRLRDLPDRDASARLSLAPVPSGGGVSLRLDLSDGRSAVRIARVPEELPRVMEALVTLPPAAPPAETPKPPVTPPNDTLPARPVVAPHAGAIDDGAVPIAFDAAVLATGRVLGPAAHVGVGVVASGDLDIDRGWILGLRVRADVANLDLEDGGRLKSVTFGGGLEFARRVSIEDALALDFGLGADGLVDVPAEGHRDGRSGDDARGDLRARAFSKAWVSGRGVSFIGMLGFEVSPIRVGGDDSLPAFGGEVGVGIGWAAL